MIAYNCLFKNRQTLLGNGIRIILEAIYKGSNQKTCIGTEDLGEEVYSSHLKATSVEKFGRIKNNMSKTDKRDYFDSNGWLPLAYNINSA